MYAEADRALTPGTVCYSDLGFMLLGWAAEQCTGTAIDELFQTTIAAPWAWRRRASVLRRQTD